MLKEELKKTLEKGQKVSVQVADVDVTDFKALEGFFASLKDMTLDVVVNNAGLALARDPFDQYDFADVQRMIDVNISAFLKVAHLSLPFLKASKGHLINLGSVAGMEAYGGGAVYCGTKHFVHAFTHALRIDLLGSGVRVTTIAPGNVETEFSEVRFKGDAARAKSVYQGFQPLKAEDIADAINYVVSAPAHVNTELMLVMPTAQAGGNIFKK
jgi:NADP-dependent 3-hydroxy acid dehydrogenase YdfG